MAKKYFGTDGIRGAVNQGMMTPEIAMRVGLAAGKLFRQGDHVHRVLVGKDTRRSGYMFEPAITAGFVAAGMDAILVGPIPTPAVAMLVKALRCDLGVMLSASHNLHEDNGIKFFGPDGYKLTDQQELDIEASIDGPLTDQLMPSSKIGNATRLEDARGRYVEFAKATLPSGTSFEGLKVVVDCANGAAYKTAPTVLWELGADVISIGISPNGFNINQGCGSTDTAALKKAVIDHSADLGVALDGDADRLILIDEAGNQVDGDQIMALIARSMLRRGALKGGGVVATVMSNLGLERAMVEDGLTLERVKVGDRYVVERMREGGFNVGGEQSGHIVLNDFTTTGDGLVAALQVLAELKRTSCPASEVCAQFTPVPQLLKNTRYTAADPLADPSVTALIAETEKTLAGKGRLVIRKSGTEPVVRVMAEGDDADQVEHLVDRLIEAIQGVAD